MTSDLGEFLREGIERATGAERFHPGLTGRARQRHHRRALTVRAAAVTGTAAVAAAVFAATVGTGGSPAAVQTTAYVVSHTEGALAAAGDGNLIERVTWVPPSNERPFEVAALVPSQGNKLDIKFLSTEGITRTMSWSSHGQVRTQGFTSDGRIAADVGPSTSGQAGSVIAVNPIAGKWYDPLVQPAAVQPQPSSTCDTVGFNLLVIDGGGGAALDNALISKALSCHLFQKAGHEQVDGTDAIKLAATPDLVRQLKENDFTASSDAALWVDARTFLPVRMVLGPQDGSTDFGWLDPTEANLAMLKVTVPDGLTEVQLPAKSSVLWGEEAATGNNQ